MALQRLRDAAERAKIELSTTMETEINLPVRHRGRQRAEAPGEETDAGEARGHGGRHRPPLGRAVQQVHEGRGR